MYLHKCTKCVQGLNNIHFRLKTLLSVILYWKFCVIILVGMSCESMHTQLPCTNN